MKKGSRGSYSAKYGVKKRSHGLRQGDDRFGEKGYVELVESRVKKRRDKRRRDKDEKRRHYHDIEPTNSHSKINITSS